MCVGARERSAEVFIHSIIHNECAIDMHTPQTDAHTPFNYVFMQINCEKFLIAIAIGTRMQCNRCLEDGAKPQAKVSLCSSQYFIFRLKTGF